MHEVIRLDCITIGDYFRCLSCLVVQGSMVAVQTSKQDENDLLVRLLLGMEKPELGKVHVLGADMAGLSVNALYELRQRIAVVHPSGGLISNLNVLENVVLPRMYHSKDAGSAINRQGQDILNSIGYPGNHYELPGFLSTYRKRLAGIARAILTEPLLVIYNAVLDGLNQEEKEKIISAALQFHRALPHRTTLFITSSAESVNSITFDTTFGLKGGLFHG